MANKSYKSSDPYVKYAIEHSLRLSPIQREFLEVLMESISQPMGMMTGAPEVMQLNCNLMKAVKAVNVLDIGVFTGFSAFNAALALPENGKIVACDITDKYFNAIGRKYFEKANLLSKVDLRIAPANETLQKLIDNGKNGTFDYAFIDADKTGYDTYYEKCLKLLRPGGIISIDNMLWHRKVLKEHVDSEDKETLALQALAKKIQKDERVDCNLLIEGDGLMLAFKR